jgi:hypothetical protein
VRRAQEVIRAMRAKTTITANTARKKEGCVAFANDDFENATRVKYDWEIIANNLSKAGWSWGCVSALDSNGRTIWIVDAHRGDGRRFIVHADELLTAFLEFESQAERTRADRKDCSQSFEGKVDLVSGRSLRAASPRGQGLSEEHDEPSNNNFHGIVAVRVSQPDRARKAGWA